MTTNDKRRSYYEELRTIRERIVELAFMIDNEEMNVDTNLLGKAIDAINDCLAMIIEDIEHYCDECGGYGEQHDERCSSYSEEV